MPEVSPYDEVNNWKICFQNSMIGEHAAIIKTELCYQFAKIQLFQGFGPDKFSGRDLAFPILGNGSGLVPKIISGPGTELFWEIPKNLKFIKLCLMNILFRDGRDPSTEQNVSFDSTALLIKNKVLKTVFLVLLL